MKGVVLLALAAALGVLGELGTLGELGELGELVALGAADVLELQREEWLAYKLQHRKLYASAAEERARRATFLRNRLAVARHNQRRALGLETFSLALNEFADLTHEEFVRAHTGYRPPTRRFNDPESEGSAPYAWAAGAGALSEHVDWRTRNAVTAVKRQGNCASCWAFSATGAIESRRFLKTGFLLPLSEQNLVDCSGNYGNHGCHDGNMDDAFMYAHDHGLAAEWSYPYEAVNGTCRYRSKALRPGAVAGFNDVLPRTEQILKFAVHQGPVAAGIVADESFQLYRRGVHYSRNCTGPPNHAVLVVGYGTDERDGDYWLVKNSWGTEWGECGYIRMARNRNNNCAIASYASVPVVWEEKQTKMFSFDHNKTREVNKCC